MRCKQVPALFLAGSSATSSWGPCACGFPPCWLTMCRWTSSYSSALSSAVASTLDSCLTPVSCSRYDHVKKYCITFSLASDASSCGLESNSSALMMISACAMLLRCLGPPIALWIASSPCGGRSSRTWQLCSGQRCMLHFVGR